MELPNDSVGISDILAYLDCPRRMGFSLKRFTDEGEPPEAQGPNNAYGSALHDAFHLIETELFSDEEAIDASFAIHGKFLGPEDLALMEEDIETYHERDWDNVETVLAEGELRAPLIKHEGRTIYFRAKIDRLYQRLDAPGRYVHIDYKTSKWRKTPQEVREDKQMWAYNWVIYENYPEIEDLQQFYDQLKFGIEPTYKTEEQRRQIKKWLQVQVRNMLADDEKGEDGLPLPSFNTWCPWCELLSSCSEPRRTAEFAQARIAVLSPGDQDGGKLDLDPDLFSHFVTELEKASTAEKALKTFQEQVKAVLRDMPEEKRAFFGYTLGKGRNIDIWTPEGMRQAHSILGDDFYALVKLTKTKVNDYFDKDDDRKKQLLDLTLKEGGQPSVKKL